MADQNKYRVRVSYSIEVAASSEADALRSAQYSSIYTEDSVRNLRQEVVCMVAPEAITEPATVGETSEPAAENPVPSDEIPYLRSVEQWQANGDL